MTDDPTPADASPGDEEVRAAGGAVWRRGPAGVVEVLLAHRPRYDDWTIPKGKLDPGESFVEAAVREVAEETGLVCAVGVELPEVRYVDHRDRPKRVRYWAMTVLEGAFTPNDEVDEVRWLALPDAVEALTHAHDRPVLDALAAHLPAA